MAKQTIADTASIRAFWLNQERRYNDRLATETDSFGRSLWEEKAKEARKKAQQYHSPAPSEAESPA